MLNYTGKAAFCTKPKQYKEIKKSIALQQEQALYPSLERHCKKITDVVYVRSLFSQENPRWVVKIHSRFAFSLAFSLKFSHMLQIKSIRTCLLESLGTYQQITQTGWDVFTGVWKHFASTEHQDAQICEYRLCYAKFRQELSVKATAESFIIFSPQGRTRHEKEAEFPQRSCLALTQLLNLQTVPDTLLEAFGSEAGSQFYNI